MNQEDPAIGEDIMQEEQRQVLQHEEEEPKIQDQKIKKERLFELPNCSICYEQLFLNISSLKCGHVFHEKCIRQNFKHRLQCPICKFKVQNSFHYTISLFFPLTEREHYVSQQDQNNLNIKEKQNNIWKLNYGNLLISYHKLKFKLRKLSSTCLQKEKSARQTRKQIRILEKKFKQNQMKIDDFLQTQAELKKNIRSLNRTITQILKQLQQKQTHIQNITDLLQIQRQQTKKVKDSFQRKIQELEKEIFYYCLQLQKTTRQLEKNQKLKKLVQSPSQFTNNFKDKLQNKKQSYEDTIKECQQILTLQKAELIAQKTKNQNLKEKIQNQSKQINQLKIKVKDQLKENTVLDIKFKRLQIAFNQSQKQNQKYRNQLNIKFTKKQQNDFDIGFSNNKSEKLQSQTENLSLNIKNNHGEKSHQKSEKQLVQLKIPSLSSTARPYGGMKPIQKANRIGYMLQHAAVQKANKKIKK